MKCSQCQCENTVEAAFCDECGVRLESACRACGERNRPAAKFCRRYGQSLAEGRSGVASSSFSTPDSYTSRHLAERILTSRAALEGERKQVTSLFADLNFFFQAEDGIRDLTVTGVQTCALPISHPLQAEGYAVDLAEDGDEALWLGQTNQYDVMVLDVMMPAKDGFTVVRQLRKKNIQIGRASCRERV